MIALRRPSAREIDSQLRSQQPQTYAELGLSAELDVPDVRARLARRYDVDVHAFALGRGRELFLRARQALAHWRHFDVPWLELHGARLVAPGQVVATLTRLAGLWFLNPCRVVYADLDSSEETAAFAYGTLPGHAESGEERFRVRFDAKTGQVVYGIAAFSRPAIALTRLGYPLARRIQKRFARASAAALARAVA